MSFNAAQNVFSQRESVSWQLLAEWSRKPGLSTADQMESASSATRAIRQEMSS
jgi:hypothetical protein